MLNKEQLFEEEQVFLLQRRGDDADHGSTKADGPPLAAECNAVARGFDNMKIMMLLLKKKEELRT